MFNALMHLDRAPNDWMLLLKMMHFEFRLQGQAMKIQRLLTYRKHFFTVILELFLIPISHSNERKKIKLLRTRFNTYSDNIMVPIL